MSGERKVGQPAGLNCRRTGEQSASERWSKRDQAGTLFVTGTESWTAKSLQLVLTGLTTCRWLKPGREELMPRRRKEDTRVQGRLDKVKKDKSRRQFFEALAAEIFDDRRRRGIPLRSSRMNEAWQIHKEMARRLRWDSEQEPRVQIETISTYPAIKTRWAAANRQPALMTARATW